MILVLVNNALIDSTKENRGDLRVQISILQFQHVKIFLVFNDQVKPVCEHLC